MRMFFIIADSIALLFSIIFLIISFLFKNIEAAIGWLVAIVFITQTIHLKIFTKKERNKF